MCFDFLYNVCPRYFYLEEYFGEISNMYVCFHVFLLDFSEIFIFLYRFSKNTLSDFMKIRVVGAEIFHAEGRK